MKSFIRSVILGGLTLCGASAAIAQDKMTTARNGDVRVVCDARGFGRQQCAANLRGYVFSSVRAASGARCEVGRNFGYDDNALWVDQGCRGEFFFTYRGDDRYDDRYNDDDDRGPGTRNDITVRCESRDGRRALCPADLRGLYFRELRQVSRTECVEGRNWGYDDRTVWAEAGCRADFTFSPGRSGSSIGGTRTPRIVACASRDGRRANCPEDLRGYSLIDVRQQSRTECVRGQTFGYDERGVWVDRGCRADFEFEYRGPGYRGSPWGSADNRGVGGSSGAASMLTCESVDNRRVTCEVPRNARVRFVEQLSRAACTEGSTWGFEQRGIWVDRGCRAQFEVLR
jgi:hypothetical protein